MPRRTKDPPGRRLTKSEALRLLDRYDADPTGALAAALRVVLELPDAEWPALIAAVDLPATERAALLGQHTAALDRLLTRLNEHRRV